MPDATKEQRYTARYQLETSTVETFIKLMAVYDNLEPAIKNHANQMIENINDSDATEDERALSLHTLMEILLGD